MWATLAGVRLSPGVPSAARAGAILAPGVPGALAVRLESGVCGGDESAAWVSRVLVVLERVMR